MKKISSLFILLILWSNLYAGGSHVQILGGSSQIEDFGNASVFGIGLDLVKNFSSGFEAGVGSEILYSDTTKYYSNVGADISLLFGYNLQNRYTLPLSFRCAFGYGIGTLDNRYTQSGAVYSTALEYEFSKKIGAGFKYKVQDFDIEMPDSTLPAYTKNILIYLYFRK